MKELEKILSDPQQQDAEGGYSADQIREAYEAGLNADKWISVDDIDKLPSFEQEVQFCHSLDEWISKGYYHKYKHKGTEYKDWFDSHDNQCQCYPTHWQPLPSPPKV